MNQYPAIPGPKKFFGERCIPFYKYDGSNLRMEWNPKRGWYKFGTRNHLFDKSDPEYGSAIELFHKTLAHDLNWIIAKYYKSAESALAYCEYFGPHSFAGQHDLDWLKGVGFNIEHNDPKRLVLIDFQVYKQCMISPQDFVKYFVNNLSDEVVAQPIIDGEMVLDQRMVNDVYLGSLNGVELNEGVVVKGNERHNRFMAKIKTKTYKEMLRRYYPTAMKEQWDWQDERDWSLE